MQANVRALEALIVSAKPLILAAANRYLGRENATHTVDDVAQEIYLRLYSLAKAGKLQGVRDIENYIYTMTKNQCLLWNKRSTAEPLPADIEDVVQGLPIEHHIALREAITQLRPPYRTVVEHILRGFQLHEIGDLLGINLNTLKSHFKRSKVLLAKQLGEEGL